MKPLVTNCPNCGAVLIDGYCNYCNTKVRFANELDFEADRFRTGHTEIMFHIKHDDGTIVIYPFISTGMSFDYSFVSFDERPNIDIHFYGYLEQPTEYEHKEVIERYGGNIKPNEKRKH